MSAMIDTELKLFFLFVLHGIFLAVCMDLLRAWRMAFPRGDLRMGLEDLFFWLAWAFRTFVLIFVYQDGSLRFYTAVAVGLGIFLYRRTIGPIIWKFTSGLLLQFAKKIDILRQKTVAKFVKKAYTEHSNLERNV